MTTPSDIFRDSVNAILSNVHTCLPGIIKSYDPLTSSATIQPALNKNFISGPMDMPILENVPVIFPRGANFSMNFPIAAGDYCLILFSERSIDLWKSVGGQVTPNDRRKFDLSDGFAIPGLLPLVGNFPAVNNTDFSINFAGSSITISQTGAVTINTATSISIGNAAAELLTILDNLLIALQGPAVTGIALGGPLNPTFVAQALTLQTQLELIKAP